MSGYRQSSFDPAAPLPLGRPARPFDRLQRTGAAIMLLGLLLELYILASVFKLTHPGKWLPPLAVVPIAIGASLVNSRRETVAIDGEQLARNRRVLLITSVICAVIIGGAVLISVFTGA